MIYFLILGSSSALLQVDENANFRTDIGTLLRRNWRLAAHACPLICKGNLMRAYVSAAEFHHLHPILSSRSRLPVVF